MLGAKAIQQLAGETELACAAGDVKRAAQLATALAAELHRLQRSSSAALRTSQTPAEEVIANEGDELDPEGLAELVGLLHQQRLAVVDRFKSLAPQLRRHLGKVVYDRVHEMIDGLQFSDAAEALESGQRPSPAPLQSA
jgi:hypothetical protein